MLHNDRDLIRAYGFVAIRFSTLEDTIDGLLRRGESLLPNVTDKELENVLRFRFSDRVKLLRKLFDWATSENIGSNFTDRDNELKKAKDVLAGCLNAAVERNDTLHSPIIADMKTGEVIRQSRDSDPKTVFAEEVYDLANRIDSLTAGAMHMDFTLKSVLGQHRFSS